MLMSRANRRVFGRNGIFLKIIKRHNFGEVVGWEFGWSPVGRPMMTAICYRIGPVLIDTALAHMRPQVLEMVERENIKSVLLTHYHEDHSGNAAEIKAKFKIPIYGERRTAEKLSRPYKIFPYQHLMWGAATPVEIKTLPPGAFEENGLRIVPVYTPGHSKDHTAYLFEEKGWLFSGDLYLSSQIKYFRADEKILDQINSLKKVMSLDFDALFCSHHPRPVDGKKFIAQKLQYLEDLYGKVADLAIRGMDESGIMKELHLKEDLKIKWLCFGNVSMKNIVRSVIESLLRGGA